MDVPVIGTNGNSYPKKGTWQVSSNYRWQKSDRHFVGSEEQVNRTLESSEVINRIHIADVTARYNLSDRTSLALGVPMFFADRSSPVRNATRQIIDRSVVQANGLSDITLAARRWMLAPESHGGGNFNLGLGVKFPSGKSNVTDVRKQFSNGAIVTNRAIVDQSIQPGDGGFGFFTEASGFKRLGRFTAYGSGTYLFNPQEVNTKADRGGTNPITRYLSIGDQYIARAGLATTFRRAGSWTLSLGGRVEGMPADDLIGGSNGFRRPGYAISLEPGVTYSRGKQSITLGVPYALYRNRTRSVADRASGGHGDAAFADYLVMVGFSRSF
jgi:hypothetical protein